MIDAPPAGHPIAVGVARFVPRPRSPRDDDVFATEHGLAALIAVMLRLTVGVRGHFRTS